jgi:hypothetical protein
MNLATAVEFQSEIARLHAEIERLRLTDAEREAIEWAVATTAQRYDDPIGPIKRERLRELLERSK